jgi:hypothetical protein
MDDEVKKILAEYYTSFTSKTYSEENNDSDILMDIFGITPELKRENRQYWGRELGMVWQKIVNEIFRNTHPQYKPAERIGGDEPFDLIAGMDAIDTKYRVGSGDAGTLCIFRTHPDTDSGNIRTAFRNYPDSITAHPDTLSK